MERTTWRLPVQYASNMAASGAIHIQHDGFRCDTHSTWGLPVPNTHEKCTPSSRNQSNLNEWSVQHGSSQCGTIHPQHGGFRCDTHPTWRLPVRYTPNMAASGTIHTQHGGFRHGVIFSRFEGFVPLHPHSGIWVWEGGEGSQKWSPSSPNQSNK